MKKIFFTALLALGMAAFVTSCSNSKKEVVDEATDNATEEVAAEPTHDGVVVLDNDSLLRPDTKVTKPTVIDFNATWCGPCKQFAPVFHQAADKFADKAVFYSIDTDVNPKTADAFGIQAIPTVVLMMPDGTVKTFVGTADILPAEKFEAILADALK